MKVPVPVLLSSSKVHVLEDQFISPCPCPQTTKSSNIVKDFAFCKQSVMYDHVKSINSVTATMHEDTMKCVLLTDVSHSLLSVVLEDQFTSGVARL